MLIRQHFIFVLLLIWVSAKPDEARLKAFETWIREGNRSPDLTDKVSVSLDGSFDQLRPGVVATQDIKTGENIGEFGIENHIICSKTLEFHDIGELVVRIHSRFGDNQEFDPAYLESLALFLLYEKYVKGEESEYKPWIDVMPEISEMNNILMWKSSEIRWLEGSPLMQRAIDRRKEAKERWDFINVNLIIPYDRIWKNVQITEEMYRWAISIVRSRTAQVIVPSGNLDIYEPGLVPFFDAFRHKPLVGDVTWEFDMLTHTLVLNADKDYRAGEEIRISFGEKCNSELLDFYGYIMQHNDNDCVHADLELPRSDPLFNEKNIIFRVRAMKNSALKFLRNGLTVELLRGARTATLTENLITNQMLLRGCPDESLGLESDYRIADYFVNRIRNIYKGYPEGDDQENIDDPEMPLRKKLALEMKKGEKEILLRLGSHYFSEMERLEKEIMSMRDEL